MDESPRPRSHRSTRGRCRLDACVFVVKARYSMHAAGPPRAALPLCYWRGPETASVSTPKLSLRPTDSTHDLLNNLINSRGGGSHGDESCQLRNLYEHMAHISVHQLTIYDVRKITIVVSGSMPSSRFGIPFV